MAFKSDRYLIEAIEKCDISKIVSLIDRGHNINIKNNLQQNFLIIILHQQHQYPLLAKKRFQMFRFLIENYNLDIQSFDINGKNLFNWSTHLNRTKEALYLLNEYPGDIDILARDETGSCSLHYAIENNNEPLVHAIVNYLLRYRLRFDTKDAYNNTPEELARKLGFEKISNFLGQACRSTIFMSKELANRKQLQFPKINLKLNSFTNDQSSTPTIFSDILESFFSIETRIQAAKTLNDWKTVVTLRESQKRLYEKKPYKLPDSAQQQTNIQSLPSVTKRPTEKPMQRSINQSEQLFRVLEFELTPSYRKAFVPTYLQPDDSNNIPRRSANNHRLSLLTSRRLSTISGPRKRDSEASQMSLSALQEIENPSFLPPVYSQHRESMTMTN